MEEARSLTYSINVKSNAETVEAGIRSLVDSLGKLRAETANSVNVDVGADIEQATDNIQSLNEDIGNLLSEAENAENINIDADTSQAEANVHSLAESVGNIGGANVEIGIDTGQAENDIQDLADNIGTIGENASGIVIDVDTSQAEANVHSLAESVESLGSDANNIGGAFRKSFLSGIDSGESFASSIKTGIGGAINFAGDKFSELKSKVTDVKDHFVQGAQSIGHGFTHPIETLKSGLGNALEAAKNKFIGMARGADEAAESTEDVGNSADNAEDDIENLGDAAEKTEGKFGALSKVLKGVGAAVLSATVAVGGFAAASVDVGMNFDSSVSQVAATMGKTVDEISDLRDFALEMGSATAFSASQAADA